ncbi:DUF1622 domain-containing protein [Synechococcus sp. PCC 7336]|uniref:DUF1622 domain-containing protein n=1 Tax=Synechococcus sp. PCC 7336 TaxID=195250 RepID=UPI0003455F71|nr:DUF1622 domain-containing protein [Synechococcus sp. PCC 7336]
MQWIGYLESSLAEVVGLLKFVLEAISVLCVFLALATTLRLALLQSFRLQDYRFVLLRLRFGSWLALALEFQLGADILTSTIAPSFEALGKLGAIALIRTFLNYFLNKELEAEAESTRKTGLQETKG